MSRVTEAALSDEDMCMIIANSPFGAGTRRVRVIPASLQAGYLGLITVLIHELGDAFHSVETEAEAFHRLVGSR